MHDALDSVRSLLDAPTPAVRTTYRKDGSANVSHVWFRFADGAFEVVIAEGRRQAPAPDARPASSVSPPRCS